MKILARKQFGTLRAIDDAGEEALRGIANGALVQVEIKRPRNAQQHRKFFAMLGIVLQNQQHYKNTEHLLAACKLGTGHVDMIRTKHGDVAIPKSISFASMSQDDFSKFYDAAVDWVVTDVIPGLKRADLDAEIEATLMEFAA
jgi:hypothetical protein